jgi:hypothetical protein
MNNALAMATAANNAIHQTPMHPAVQTALNFLFNTGDATLVPDYGNRKPASQCFEYLSLREMLMTSCFAGVFGGTGITRLTTQVTANAALGFTDVV